VIAEVKKPEIKEALEKLNDHITDKNSRIQIVDPQALATITGHFDSPGPCDHGVQCQFTARVQYSA